MSAILIHPLRILIGLLGLGLFIAACATDTPAQSVTPTSGINATDSGDTPASSFQLIGSGIQGGDPEFNSGIMRWQAYWLSRDHFGPLAMASGLGIPFEPPMDMIRMVIQNVAQNPEDPVMIPKNMMPLQAVYESASPRLLNDPRNFDPADFEGLRLDPATFNQSVSMRGQAELMLKESQWGHIFAGAHFGELTGDWGAQQRFMGVMVTLIARMQGQYAMQNLMGEDGLYYDSDGTLDYTANWVMLHALSDIASLASGKGGRYSNPEIQTTFDGAANLLFQALKDREPESPQEAAASIRALVYRASTGNDEKIRDAALIKAKKIGDGLSAYLPSSDVVGKAAGIAGLISVAVVDDNGEKYHDAAVGIFQEIAKDFDRATGTFKSKSVYSADDIAWIIGGLNSLAQRGNEATRDAAADMLLAFYESAINQSGIQLSAPPGKNGAMASQWETNLPSEIYYHPVNSPSPGIAGKLPVPAEEISWDGSQWRVTSDRIVTGGAMHLANELNWLGPLDSVPFPQVITTVSTASGR